MSAPQPAVSLLDFTGCGKRSPERHAAELLIFTKRTRLAMEPGGMKALAEWTPDQIMKELQYMANTIPSSWEFVKYTFLINNVTRAFTHQLVRTRTGSYAQQTMRVLDVSGWDYTTGPSIDSEEHSSEIYHRCMDRIANSYDALVASGAAIEDARGLLPTNIHTNIVASFDLRTLSDTMRKRASSRTQGEYRAVMEGMRNEVLRVHPFASMFFGRTFDTAAADLEALLHELLPPGDERTNAVKLIDQMRATA